MAKAKSEVTEEVVLTDDLEINLGDIETTEFTAINAGTYDAIVFGTPEPKKGKNPPHNPYLNVQYKIVGGDYDGRYVWGTIQLSKSSLWRLQQTLERLGVDGSDGKLSLGQVRNGMAGKPCRLVVGVGEYNNKKTNDVLEVLPADASAASGSNDLF